MEKKDEVKCTCLNCGNDTFNVYIATIREFDPIHLICIKCGDECYPLK